MYKFYLQSVFHLVILCAIYEVSNFPEEVAVQKPESAFIGFSICQSNYTDQ